MPQSQRQQHQQQHHRHSSNISSNITITIIIIISNMLLAVVHPTNVGAMVSCKYQTTTLCLSLSNSQLLNSHTLILAKYQNNHWERATLKCHALSLALCVHHAELIVIKQQQKCSKYICLKVCFKNWKLQQINEIEIYWKILKNINNKLQNRVQ